MDTMGQCVSIEPARQKRTWWRTSCGRIENTGHIHSIRFIQKVTIVRCAVTTKR